MNRDRKGIIYAHINKINGKMYIGQTTQTLKERFKKDGKGYKDCTKFYNAIKKHGWDNFKCIILECGLDVSEIDEREQYWISYYDSVNTGYNIDLGGSNHHMSDEHKLNIKNALLKYSRKIICVNNGNIYNSTQEAMQLTGANHISDCCTGKLQSSGSDENGYALIWRYLDEYNEGEDFILKQQNKINEPIICITTGEIYSCIKEAASKLNIDDGSIARCCNGIRLTAGMDENGQLLSWKYLCDYQINEDSNNNISCKQKHLFIRNINISVDDYISIHLFALNKLSIGEYKLFTYCMSLCYEDFPLSSKYIAPKINLSEDACYRVINKLIDYGFIIKINNYGFYIFNNNIIKDKILKTDLNYCNKKIQSYNTQNPNNFKINNMNFHLYHDKLNKIIDNALLFMPTKSLTFKLFMYILLYFLQGDNCFVINNQYVYDDIRMTHDAVLTGLKYLIEIGYLTKEEYGKKVYYLDVEKMSQTFEQKETETGKDS